MSANHLSIRTRTPILDLEELQLSNENRSKINQLIEEFEYIDVLTSYNLPVDNKILLYGSTGCGKTATAHAIAKKLDKKIITLHLGEFVSARLGETAKNITSVFRDARIQKGILFIDEFDFVGKSRDDDQKDSGEMRRVVNALLQQIDALDKNTMLIAATNYLDVIDTALLRRFQLKLGYEMPSKIQLDIYYDNLLNAYPKEFTNFERIYNLSYAEAKDYTLQRVKENVIRAAKKEALK